MPILSLFHSTVSLRACRRRLARSTCVPDAHINSHVSTMQPSVDLEYLNTQKF
jgi:hypothetical protein